MQGTCPVVRGLASCAEPLHELKRESLDDFIAFPAEESEKRKTNRHVASEISAAVNEHHFRALDKCSCLCSHYACRARSYYKYIHFVPYRDFPCGLLICLYVLFHKIIAIIMRPVSDNSKILNISAKCIANCNFCRIN